MSEDVNSLSILIIGLSLFTVVGLSALCVRIERLEDCIRELRARGRL